MPLTDAEKWELMCWDERVKNAQMVLGVAEGERRCARDRIAAAHGLNPARPYRFLPDGQVVQDEMNDGARSVTS